MRMRNEQKPEDRPLGCDACETGLTPPNKLRVLIVEDDPTQADMLRTLIRREGFDVES